MFIIFGNSFKTYVEAKGRFNCPNCKRKEIYEVKTQQEYFKLFFIKLINLFFTFFVDSPFGNFGS